MGRFSVDISSVGSPMDAPLYMRIRFGEIPAELAGDSSSYEGWLSKSWIQEEYIHLDELPAKLSLPRRYSFRYVELKVLDTSPKWQAVFENPEVVKETSADYGNLKEISVEEELKKIYEVSVKTLAECMQDVFEDGPKRDRRLWIGDLRLQALANYVTFDNVELVKRCLYLFGAMNTTEGKIPANVFVKPASLPDDTFLFDYSLFFISVLYDYETAHPDIEFLKELFPVKGIATPYMYHHVTEALFEAGLQEEAIRLLKSYWGEMLRLGADTFWEAFEPENPNYSPYGNPIVSSYCHAWSCTPVHLIHKYLL